MSEKTADGTSVNLLNNHDRGKFGFHRLLRIISIIIPLAVLGNIIYAAIASEAGIIEKLASYKIEYLALAIALVIIPLGTHSLRLLLWSRAFKVRLKPIQAFKTAIIADIGSAATPTIVGGGYIKLFFMIGYGFRPAQATLMMILGTIEDVAFFAVALPVVITITRAWDNPYVIHAVKNLISHWPILLTLVVGVSLVIFIYRCLSVSSNERIEKRNFNQGYGFWAKLVIKFRQYKKEFIAAIKFVISQGKGTLALATLFSGIGWACRYASINALILGLGYDVDPLLYTLLHWIVFSTMTMIPTPGAIGGAEISFALVFSGLLPSSIIPIMTGVWRFITFYMNIAAGAIYLAIVGPGFSQKQEADVITEQTKQVTA